MLTVKHSTVSKWDLPGDPVVRAPCFNCQGLGSIPDEETKIWKLSHVVWPVKQNTQ